MMDDNVKLVQVTFLELPDDADSGLTIDPNNDLYTVLADEKLLKVQYMPTHGEDVKIDPKCCYAGEVGLSGEIRPATRSEQRISEAARLGFHRIVVSGYLRKTLPNPPQGIEIVYINKLDELARILFRPAES